MPQSPDEWQQRLLGLSLLTEVNGKVFCTIAGLVLFGKKPRRYLRQAGLRVMVFDALDKEYQARLDEILDGPMVGRWDFVNGSRQLVDAGILEQFEQIFKPFITEESAEVGAGLRREKRLQYPLEALREVLLNALAHRDWTRFIEIEVCRFADRLEVISPGSLTNSMTIEKMKAGQRSARNTIIMEVLRDYGYVDSRGMGVRTKIIPLLKAYTGKEPEFEATEDYLKTVMYRV